MLFEINNKQTANEIQLYESQPTCFPTCKGKASLENKVFGCWYKLWVWAPFSAQVSGWLVHPPSLRLRRSIIEQKWLLLILPSFLFILSSCSLFLLLQVVSSLPTLSLGFWHTQDKAGVRQKDESWKEKRWSAVVKEWDKGQEVLLGSVHPHQSQESRLD